jgi:hypothetical protein
MLNQAFSAILTAVSSAISIASKQGREVIAPRFLGANDRQSCFSFQDQTRFAGL